MAFGTLFGFIMAAGLIVGSIIISTDKSSVFLNYPSILIVIGGTIGALFISYEFKTSLKSLKTMLSAFFGHKDSATSLKDQVGKIVKWGYIIQKNGLQGLESEVTDKLRNEDDFLTYGVDLVVTGYTGIEVKQILTQAIEAKEEKQRKITNALAKMGGDAPAFGMLGTLIGLVVMLGSMGGDPASVGPAMAVALITTFYGIFAARVFFIPIATKIEARNDVTLFKNALQVEGLVLLAERKSPRFIQDKLNSFVDASEQFSIDKDIAPMQSNSSEAK